MRFFHSITGLLNFSIWSLSPYGVLYHEICSPTLVSAADTEEEQEVVCNEDGVCNNSNSTELSWWEDPEVKLLEMWELLDCGDLFEEDDRPVHNESTWMLMRGAYIASVKGEINMEAYDKKQLYGNGFPPGSMEVKVFEEKGRGVYATKSFKKGELVWSDIFSACFKDGMAYRLFLGSLPVDLACDVFEWAYSGETYGVCVDLDEGSLINHSTIKKENERDWETGEGEEQPNIGIIDYEHIAIRDINPGDELLIDYGDFAEESGWEHLGLGTWKGYNGEDGDIFDGK